MKSCPSCKNLFVDHTYNYCLQDGSPLLDYEEPEVETVIRHKKIEINLTSSSNAPAMNYANYQGTADLIEPIIAINIAQQYPFVKNETELYEVTRGLWRLSRQRAEKAEYALAVYQREIKEVYKIESWQAASFDLSEFWIKRKKEQGEEIDPKINNGRFQFFGEVAPAHIRIKYVGKQIPKPHGQNPIRYFNC